MKHLASKARLAMLLAGVVAQPAMAAPFCIHNQVIPPLCIYNDAQECQREAQRQNAQCDVNTAEMQVTPQFGKYCVVTSGRTSNCNYTDPNTCSQEANRLSGACVPAPGQYPFQAPNPYSPVEGY